MEATFLSQSKKHCGQWCLLGHNLIWSQYQTCIKRGNGHRVILTVVAILETAGRHRAGREGHAMSMGVEGCHPKTPLSANTSHSMFLRTMTKTLCLFHQPAVSSMGRSFSVKTMASMPICSQLLLCHIQQHGKQCFPPEASHKLHNSEYTFNFIQAVHVNIQNHPKHLTDNSDSCAGNKKPIAGWSIKNLITFHVSDQCRPTQWQNWHPILALRLSANVWLLKNQGLLFFTYTELFMLSCSITHGMSEKIALSACNTTHSQTTGFKGSLLNHSHTSLLLNKCRL